MKVYLVTKSAYLLDLFLGFVAFLFEVALNFKALIKDSLKPNEIQRDLILEAQLKKSQNYHSYVAIATELDRLNLL